MGRRLFAAGIIGAWLAATFVYEPSIHWKVKHYHALMTIFSFGVPPSWVDRIVPAVGTYMDDEGVISRDGNFGSVRYRSYEPGEERDPENVIVWVHGGGFVLGHVWEFQIDRSCRQLAKYAKTRVVSVEYRKAPDFHFKAAADDVLTVLMGVRDEFKMKRVALAGESAGATIALSVALKNSNLIQHLLLVYPGLEHGIDEEMGSRAWIVSNSVVGWFRSHHLLPESKEELLELEEFNALLRDPDSHMDQISRLPTTNLVSAGLDPLTLGVRKLERKLKFANVKWSHDHYAKSVHGFFCLNVDSSETAIKVAAEKILRD